MLGCIHAVQTRWVTKMTDIQLAVCSEMVFTELPFIDRVRRIDELGFAVEIWSWHDKDLDALAATGARFSSMTGYLQGDLIDPASADEVVRTAELSIKAAETLGVPRLNLHTAELVDGKAARPRHRATGEMWLTARRSQRHCATSGSPAPSAWRPGPPVTVRKAVKPPSTPSAAPSADRFTR